MWNDDILDFCTEEIGESWQINVRPSSEILFITLLRYKPDLICGMIFETIQQLGQQNQATLEVMVIECAIYKSLSLAANELFDKFDFEEFFEKTLIPRVEQVQNLEHGKLVHRSVLQVLGKWIDVKPFVRAFESTLNFISISLQPQFDFAVRLAAAETLKFFMYELENDYIPLFYAHQESCVNSLQSLLEMSNEDLKMKILGVFNCILERIETNKAVTFIEKLVQVLNNIWIGAANNNMLRVSVVVTLTTIVEAQREHSMSSHDVVLPLIVTSCNLGECSIYMMADGLELWTSVMHHCTHMTQNLLDLFPLLFHVLEQGFDEARLGFHIVECYILLGGSEFCNHQSFANLATTVNVICKDMGHQVIGYLLPVLLSSLHVSSQRTIMCFDKTFIHVFTQALNSDDTRSYQNRAKIFHLVAWLCLLERDTARLLMCQVFCEADQDKSMGRFVGFICGELDSICDCEQKKAVCMGMLACCEAIRCSDVFNQVFEKVVCACVQALHDTTDEHKNDEVILKYSEENKKLSTEVDCWLDIEDNLHQKREDKLLRSNMTLKISLLQVVNRSMQQFCNNFFNSNSNQFESFLLSKVDSLVVKDLNDYLTHAAKTS